MPVNRISWISRAAVTRNIATRPDGLPEKEEESESPAPAHAASQGEKNDRPFC